jgi:hypothetical protein
MASKALGRFAALALSATLAACVDVDVADDTQPDETSPSPAADYCEKTGGTVETRQPYWNTNADPSVWVELPGSMELCWYQTLDDEDQSRIYVDLVTIYAEDPTLAAAAYLAQVPLGRTTGNPAEASCHENLNGSAWFGSAGASGGGRVNLEDEGIHRGKPLCLPGRVGHRRLGHHLLLRWHGAGDRSDRGLPVRPGRGA